MFLGPGSCYYSGILDHLFSYTVRRVKNKPLSASTVPPTSTWIIQSTSASSSRQPGHQGIWPSWSQSLPVGFVSWISLARFLPRWVSAVLRCHRGLKGFFSAGERELINLTVERQHRCAGIKAVRAQIQMKEGAGVGYRCFWLPVSLWRRGQGSNGEIGGKHIWYIFWLTDGKSLMQTSYMGSIIMHPVSDLCKHFNIWPVY